MDLKQKKGFTLMEIIVVMIVLVVLTLAAYTRFIDYTFKADDARIEANILNVKNNAIFVDSQEIPFGTHELSRDIFKERVGEISRIPSKEELDKYCIEKTGDSQMSVTYGEEDCDSNPVTIPPPIEEPTEEEPPVEEPVEEPVEDSPYINTILLADSDYEFDIPTRSITNYNLKNVNKIILPDSFEIDGIIYEVLRIDNGAFKNKNINEIVVPNTVIQIADMAFQGNDMKKITFGDKVEYVDESSFFQNSLKSIVFSNSVKAIGKKAFMQNGTIISVTFGENVEIIGEHAFTDNIIQEILIPSSVKRINSGAFRNNNLSTLIFEDGVIYVGKHAFEGNDNITSITIGSNVIIENGAIHSKFEEYYEDNGAGIYIFSNNKWIKQ